IAAEDHVAGRGFEKPGQQIDERGLAGAIGADQGLASARRDTEIHLGGGDEAPEPLDEIACLQSVSHRGLPAALRAGNTAASRRNPPMMPSRAKSTTSTSRSPSQNCQYWGLMSASR